MTGWAKPKLSLFAAVYFPCFSEASYRSRARASEIGTHRAYRYCNACLIVGITSTCTCLWDATGKYIPMQIPPSLYSMPCPNKNGGDRILCSRVMNISLTSGRNKIIRRAFLPTSEKWSASMCVNI
ncbi:hypothetical protein EDB86DRAFT_2889902, partial [Lactarius hatsudake]